MTKQVCAHVPLCSGHENRRCSCRVSLRDQEGVQELLTLDNSFLGGSCDDDSAEAFCKEICDSTVSYILRECAVLPDMVQSDIGKITFRHLTARKKIDLD